LILTYYGSKHEASFGNRAYRKLILGGENAKNASQNAPNWQIPVKTQMLNNVLIDGDRLLIPIGSRWPSGNTLNSDASSLRSTPGRNTGTLKLWSR